MEITNNHFKEGQIYRGMVNGVELTVAEIKKVGRSTLICFRDVKTGAIYEVELETAKRLLLRLEK